MNQYSDDSWLKALFHVSNEEKTSVEHEHVEEMDEKLACLRLGLLDQKEAEEVYRHLTSCSHCRNVLGSLSVDQHALDLSDQKRNQHITLSPRSNHSRWALLAMAASILWFVFQIPIFDSGPDALLQAEIALRNGKPEEALELLRSHLPPQGLQAASPQFRNLWLQAESGQTVVVSLHRRHSLLDHHYEPNGFSFMKPLPPQSETLDRLEKQWLDAIETYPEDVLLLVNAGHFLLQRNKFSLAKKIFTQAVEVAPRSTSAHLGLGMSHYELAMHDYEEGKKTTAEKQFRMAEDQFQTVLQQAPDHFAAHLNLAMTLEKLRQFEQANIHWQQALTLCSESRRKEQIIQHLKDAQKTQQENNK